MSRPSSPLFWAAAATGPGADTGKEGNVAPEVEHHHEKVVVIEDLGASQTGAEKEVTQVSAETERVPKQQQALPQQPAPAPATQASRPSAATKRAPAEATKTPPAKRVPAEAATKQAEKEKKKQKAPKLTQTTLPPTLQAAVRTTPQTSSTETTVLSESISAFKTSFVEFKQGLMDVLQKKGAAALSGLKVAPAASAATSSAAAPPNQEKAVSLHVSSAAQQADATLLKEGDGFLSKRTASGGSYGSLDPYIDTWNNADLAEVSSNPQPHPAGPSAIAQRLFEVGMISDRLGRGIQLADEAAQVTFTFYLGSFYFGKTYASPQSPRFGLNEYHSS